MVKTSAPLPMPEPSKSKCRVPPNTNVPSAKTAGALLEIIPMLVPYPVKVLICCAAVFVSVRYEVPRWPLSTSGMVIKAARPGCLFCWFVITPQKQKREGGKKQDCENIFPFHRVTVRGIPKLKGG